MLAREQTPPKAVNIIRPSMFARRSTSQCNGDQSQSYSNASVLSTAHSTISSANRIPPTIFNPASFASGFSMLGQHSQPSWQSARPPSPTPSFMSSIFPQRLVQRARSNSTLSKSTFVTADDTSDLDLDSIDGITDDETESETESDEDDISEDESQSDYESQSDNELPTQVVAKIKHGTIMNGRGEFVSKGSTETFFKDDDARVNRKIGDLEIEKNSLLTLNQTLAATVKRQEAHIAELQKRLDRPPSTILFAQSSANLINGVHSRIEWPLSPVSETETDKQILAGSSEASIITPEGSVAPAEGLTEEEVINDLSFQRVCSILQNLIEGAQAAVLQEYTPGRVLTDYNDSSDEEEADEIDEIDDIDYSDDSEDEKEISGKPWSPPGGIKNTPMTNMMSGRPLRRVDEPLVTPKHQLIKNKHQSSPALRPAFFLSQSEATKRTPMEKSLSRNSSPPVMTPSHQTKPPGFTFPLQRNPIRSSSRQSSLRMSQEPEQPKWY
ncbi:hypothetical protein J3Q64DRAFT_1700302 [Phycomyces blakesleeanus]|uniref:Uncharacterized protein n=1 Tax=Phycomyces blakesleeanus TaxID=4837 RepID=A0ABR3AVX4_PHYBL